MTKKHSDGSDLSTSSLI